MGRPVWYWNATANDSDKTILTVATGKVVQPLYLAIKLKCTATVGNRILRVDITDGANYVWRNYVMTALTANQNGTQQIYFDQPYTRANDAFDPVGADAINTTLQQGAPLMYLPAGYTIRVWDSAAVDAAADDLTVSLHYVEYDV